MLDCGRDSDASSATVFAGMPTIRRTLKVISNTINASTHFVKIQS